MKISDEKHDNSSPKYHRLYLLLTSNPAVDSRIYSWIVSSAPTQTVSESKALQEWTQLADANPDVKVYSGSNSFEIPRLCFDSNGLYLTIETDNCARFRVIFANTYLHTGFIASGRLCIHLVLLGLLSSFSFFLLSFIFSWNLRHSSPPGRGGGYLGQVLLGMCRWPLRTSTPL